MEKNRKIGRKIVIGVLRLYQLLISPFLGPSCKFEPCCSRYTMQAVDRFGIVKGGWLSLRRILRCHPFHLGGYDPVPEEEKCRRDYGN